MMGGRCVGCKISDPRVLQLNHKNGGGTKERKGEGWGGAQLVRAILHGSRAVDDLELRCANCNVLYEYEVGRRKFIT